MTALPGRPVLFPPLGVRGKYNGLMTANGNRCSAKNYVNIVKHRHSLSHRHQHIRKGKVLKIMEKMISRKDAAKILGISVTTLDAARLSGQISYVQYVPNGCVFFTKESIQEYIAKCLHRAHPTEMKQTYRKRRK